MKTPAGSNGTGIDYPTVELGGKTYTVKFTRGGLLYRLSKTGTNLADLTGTGKRFSAVMDVLHAAFFGQYDGTVEELAELVFSEEKMTEVGAALDEALKKVFPVPPTAATESAEASAPKPN